MDDMVSSAVDDTFVNVPLGDTCFSYIVESEAKNYLTLGTQVQFSDVLELP